MFYNMFATWLGGFGPEGRIKRPNGKKSTDFKIFACRKNVTPPYTSIKFEKIDPGVFPNAVFATRGNAGKNWKCSRLKSHWIPKTTKVQRLRLQKSTERATWPENMTPLLRFDYLCAESAPIGLRDPGPI